MGSKIFVYRSVIILWLVCVMMGGCAATKQISDDIMGARPALKKKIAILPASTNQPISDLHELVPAVVANFMEQNCEAVLIVETPAVNDALTRVTAGGGPIDRLALAEVGRKHGLSAVVQPQIDNVDLFKTKEGIWWFRDIQTFLHLALRLRTYDVETTALRFDEIMGKERALPETMMAEDLNPLEVDDKLTRSLLFEVADKATERLCESLTHAPWKGYIVDEQDGIFRVSAGQDVGLKVGDELDVFAMTDPLQGVNQQIYLIPGQKIGEVKQEQVLEHHSEARKLSGDNLEDSACLMLKR